MVTFKVHDENTVEVKVELKRDNKDFDRIVNVIRNVPERYYEKECYAWIVKKEYTHALYDALDQMTMVAFLSKESEIFGAKTVPSLPDFELKDDYLNELAIPLRPFQTVGVSFLHDVKRAILGDQMGLGKTPSILATIWRLYREGKIKRALICVPSSIIYQWFDPNPEHESEIRKFLPQASAIVIDGTVKKRQKIYEQIEKEEPLFCIIGHEMMRNDIDILSKMEWGCVAIDEGHRIRNYDTQLTKSAKKLKAEYKFIATGTPIQNRPEEIWSLFDFIEPTVFGNWWYFRKKYVVMGEKFGQKNMVIGYRNLDDLYNRIGSRMLRRLKTDVDIELPRLLINNHKIPMTAQQEKIHRMIDSDLSELVELVESYRQYDELGNITREHPSAARILGLFTMLQEVADSPELLLMSDSQIAEAYKPYCEARSGKIEELKDIIRDIQHYEPNAKIIIFTQFERMQRIVARELGQFGRCVILNGSMNAVEKQKAQNDFRFSPDAKFFLSTDSGNYGINLQVASYVVNIDIPWNPAVWHQRYSRAHRFGSEHEAVNVINLISMESIDESIYNTMYSRSLNADMLTDRDKEERKILATPDAANIKRLLSTVRKMQK